MRLNKVKSALKAGKIVIGTEVSRFKSPELAQIYAAAGFDFVFIDMEHTPFNFETVADIVKVARLADIVPIIRVPNAEYHFIARALDVGAQGIIVPRVSTLEQVRDVVNWIWYPPEGIRGFAISPSQTEYKDVTPRHFVDALNRETLVVIQIERRQALQNLDEILSVPGIDVAALGYMDLSVDLEIPGETEHPLLQNSIQSVIDACERHKVTAGIIAADLEFLSYWVDKGARFVSYANDGIMLLRAATEAAQEMRYRFGISIR